MISSSPISSLPISSIPSSGNTAYSLALGSGTYTITGRVLTTNIARGFALPSGTYTITGRSASLTIGRAFALPSGAYTITGRNAALTIGRTVALASGTYLINGQAASLVWNHAGGQAYTLALASGTYMVTGNTLAMLITRLSTAVPTRPDKEGYSYHPHTWVEEKREELELVDNKLAEAEQRKLAAHKRAKARLLAEKAAIKLAALEAQIQEEIRVLRIERARLMRLIDDEEAVLVLLLSMPFH